MSVDLNDRPDGMAAPASPNEGNETKGCGDGKECTP